MARKRQIPIKREEVFRIEAKFAPVLFFPSNAVEAAFWRRDDVEPRFMTLDNVLCKPVFLATMNGENERFDDICQNHFGHSFQTIRSIWISRLGTNLDSYWHLVKLEKI